MKSSYAFPDVYDGGPRRERPEHGVHPRRRANAASCDNVGGSRRTCGLMLGAAIGIVRYYAEDEGDEAMFVAFDGVRQPHDEHAPRPACARGAVPHERAQSRVAPGRR